MSADCPSDKPICINGRVGKGKIIQEDCLGTGYTPAKGLAQMLDYLKDKKSNQINSSLPLAKCYTQDLGWYLVIQDIINQLSDEIQDNEPITGSSSPAPSGEKIPEEEMQELVNESEEDLKGIEELKKNQNIPSIKINLVELFKGIIDYGLIKWNINETEFKEKCETEACAYLEKHSSDKDDCIAFLVLRLFQDLIDSPGFKEFSKCVMDRTQIATLNPNPNAKISISQLLKQVKEVFVIARYIMNDKTELSNFYNGKNPQEVFKILQETFKKMNEAFSLFFSGEIIKKGGGGEDLLLKLIFAPICIVFIILDGGPIAFLYQKNKTLNILKKSTFNCTELFTYKKERLYVMPDSKVYRRHIFEGIFGNEHYKMKYAGKVYDLKAGKVPGFIYTEEILIGFVDILRTVNLIPYKYTKGDENIKKSFENDASRDNKKKAFATSSIEGNKMQAEEDKMQEEGDNSGYIQIGVEGGKKTRKRTKRSRTKRSRTKRSRTKRSRTKRSKNSKRSNKGNKKYRYK